MYFIIIESRSFQKLAFIIPNKVKLVIVDKLMVKEEDVDIEISYNTSNKKSIYKIDLGLYTR